MSYRVFYYEAKKIGKNLAKCKHFAKFCQNFLGQKYLQLGLLSSAFVQGSNSLCNSP